MESFRDKLSNAKPEKKLSDLCLDCVGQNLHSINRLGRYLLTEHKEMLIKRLAGHKKLTPDFAPHVTYNLFSPNLRKIDFSYSDQISDNILKQFGSCGCQFEFIKIKSCPAVTDEGILSVTSQQYGLKSVKLKKLQITSKGILKLKSHKLKHLDLRGCQKIDSEGIIQVSKQCPNIASLNISKCNKVSNEAVGQIASILGDHLEVLILADKHDLTDDSIISIAHNCPSLKVLDLVGGNLLTSTGMCALFNNCSKLQKLDLSYCSLAIAHSNVLRNIPLSMQEISLCGAMINSESLLIESLRRLTSLKKLRLCGIPVLTDALMEELLEQIGGSIEELDLSGGLQETLSDKTLRSVATHCTQLKMLSLKLLNKLTGYPLLPLLNDPVRAAKLKNIQFASKNINLDVLQAIARHCVNLEVIDLASLQCVDDALLCSLGEHCPKLRDVNLKSCHNVTDEGVCELARMCPLEVIVLSGLRRITDKCVFTLAHCCPYIDKIYFNGCYSVSRGAVLYLVDYCIPAVHYGHKIPNAKAEMTMVKDLATGEYHNVGELL